MGRWLVDLIKPRKKNVWPVHFGRGLFCFLKLKIINIEKIKILILSFFYIDGKEETNLIASIIYRYISIYIYICMYIDREIDR